MTQPLFTGRLAPFTDHTDGRETELVKTGQMNLDHLSGHFRGHFRGRLRGMFRGSLRGKFLKGCKQGKATLVGAVMDALVGARMGTLVGPLVGPLVGSRFAFACSVRRPTESSTCSYKNTKRRVILRSTFHRPTRRSFFKQGTPSDSSTCFFLFALQGFKNIMQQDVTLPSLQKTLVDFCFELSGNFAFNNGGDFGEFFLVSVSHRKKHENSKKNSGKIRSKIQDENSKNSGKFRSATFLT